MPIDYTVYETTIEDSVQSKAAKVDFDWPEIEPVFAKLQEEMDEIKETRNEGFSQEAIEEVGDPLFACLNLARRLKVDPKLAIVSLFQ